MNLIFAVIALGIWAVTSRYLFRRWVKNDTLMLWDKKCSHGYETIHKHESCHGKHLVSHLETAELASLTALIFPVTLFFLFIMHKPPMNARALQESIRELTAENERMRREHDDH